MNDIIMLQAIGQQAGMVLLKAILYLGALMYILQKWNVRRVVHLQEKELWFW